jgi:hypothetical protein
VVGQHFILADIIDMNFAQKRFFFWFFASMNQRTNILDEWKIDKITIGYEHLQIVCFNRLFALLEKPLFVVS